LTIETARHAEQQKYIHAYCSADYRMGAGRYADARADVAALPGRGSLLDVGCGRGEVLALAESLGFAPARGTEVVADLIDGVRVVQGAAHDLPFTDDSFDVACLFDVIEHLLPGDDERACRELGRVATRHVLLTANNLPSWTAAGDDLHINKRPYDEWDALFRAWFDGNVTRLGRLNFSSERWRIDL